MAKKTACILNGGDASNASRSDSVTDALRGLLESDGWGVVEHRIRDLDIAPCLGCFGCWVKTPGVCVIEDDGRRAAKSVAQSDLAVFLTPVTFGGYSATLKNQVDRLIPLILPYFTFVGSEVHHVRRYNRYPNLLGVGLLPAPDAGAESLFRRVVLRNSINMHAPEVEACFVYESEEDIGGALRQALVEVTA